jgi:hypothetical protein
MCRESGGGRQRFRVEARRAIRVLDASVQPAGYTHEPFAGKTANQPGGERLARLDAFIEHALAELSVPGAPIAVKNESCSTNDTAARTCRRPRRSGSRTAPARGEEGIRAERLGVAEAGVQQEEC